MIKTSTVTTVEFDFPMEESEFRDQEEYEKYKSRCRESALAVGLSQLRFRLAREGLTDGEWSRVLAENLRRILQDMP